jgi:hypothetical protein
VDGTFLCDREPNIVYCSPLLPASSAFWYQSAIGRLYNALFSLFVGLVHNYYCCVRIHTPPQPYQYLPTDFLIPCAVTYPKCGGCPRNLIYSGSGLSCSHPECLATWMLGQGDAISMRLVTTFPIPQNNFFYEFAIFQIAFSGRRALEG